MPPESLQMITKLGIPLMIVTILTPLDVYLASQPNHILDDNTLIPIGFAAIVLIALAKIVWWLATKSKGIEDLEQRMIKLELKCKAIENDLKILPSISEKIDGLKND